MGSSPDESDVERVDRDYVDPDSTDRSEIRDDLEDAGIEGDAATAFENRMLDTDAVVDAVESSESGIVTRDDVESAVDSSSVPHAEGREGALVDDASQEIGAPTESSLANARGSVAQRVGDDGVVRTNPDLDPLGGSDGRAIGEVSEVTQNTGGRGGGLREGVEPRGEGRGVYYYEDTSSGERYPVAEVNI